MMCRVTEPVGDRPDDAATPDPTRDDGAPAVVPAGPTLQDLYDQSGYRGPKWARRRHPQSEPVASAATAVVPTAGPARSAPAPLSWDERVAAVEQRAVALIERIRDSGGDSLARFQEATKLVEMLRQVEQLAAQVRASLAFQIKTERELTLAKLARLTGVSTSRAGQLVDLATRNAARTTNEPVEGPAPDREG
jgi:hypothetical protein